MICLNFHHLNTDYFLKSKSLPFPRYYKYFLRKGSNFSQCQLKAKETNDLREILSIQEMYLKDLKIFQAEKMKT